MLFPPRHDATFSCRPHGGPARRREILPFVHMPPSAGWVATPVTGPVLLAAGAIASVPPNGTAPAVQLAVVIGILGLPRRSRRRGKILLVPGVGTQVVTQLQAVIAVQVAIPTDCTLRCRSSGCRPTSKNKWSCTSQASLGAPAAAQTPRHVPQATVPHPGPQAIALLSSRLLPSFLSWREG